MRRLARRVAAIATAAVGLGLLGVSAAAADASADHAQSGPEPSVDVIEVDGYLDPVLVDFIDTSLTRAVDAGAIALVLQLDSRGVVVEADRFDRLIARLERSEVPLATWVGPSGAVALGGAGRLVEVADHAGVAPGSVVEVGGRELDDEEAAGAGVADIEAPTLGDLIVNLPGVEVREVEDGELVRREPVTPTRFFQLPLLDQLMHTVASPPVAYLLFIAGMALLVFELYTAGIGIAGATGAVFFVLGSYGLAVLPTNPVGIGLLVVSMFGFAVDVQAGMPRFWTGVGTAAVASGSLLLFDGVAQPWIALGTGIVGILIFFIGAAPAVARSRFSTATIGREWMIGELGLASTAIDPDGVVSVRGAPWKARTNRATPIDAGAEVRVAGIDGLALEVEPLEGAARDYRERSHRDPNAAPGISGPAPEPTEPGTSSEVATDPT
ncbi:MAG: NfeD family protein [Acidimicrobiales bacterium]